LKVLYQDKHNSARFNVSIFSQEEKIFTIQRAVLSPPRLPALQGGLNADA